MRLYSGRGTSRCRKADANRREMSVPPRLIFGSYAAAEGPRQSPSQSANKYLRTPNADSSLADRLRGDSITR